MHHPGLEPIPGQHVHHHAARLGAPGEADAERGGEHRSQTDDPAGDKVNRTNYVTKALDELLAGQPISQSETRSYGCSIKYAK